MGRYCFHRCLSVWGGGGKASWDKSDGRVPPPPCPLDMGTGYLPHYPLATDIWWSSLETCSIQTCSLEDLPLPVLTPCGGQRNPYSWKVGGTHPTGMLSCLMMMSPIFNIVNKLKKHGIKNNLSNRICVELDYQRIQTKRYPFHDHRYTVFH